MDSDAGSAIALPSRPRMRSSSNRMSMRRASASMAAP